MVFVAAVAVAAVAAGGVLAAGRGPQNDPSTAAPLVTSVPLKMAPASTVKIDAKSLARGADPRITYLRDRTVFSGDGSRVKVPGTAEIFAVGRLHDAVLTLQLDQGQRSALVIFDASGKQIGRVAAVDSLVTSADGQASAYASGGRYAANPEAGGTVYYQHSAAEPPDKLPLPNVYDLQVLGVTERTVYFRAGKIDSPWQLYHWQVGQPKPVVLDKLASPTVLSGDGTLAAGYTVYNDSGSCTAVAPPTTGTHWWRTCQYQLTHFSPGKVFAAGTPVGQPLYGDVRAVALDAKTGSRLREWTGPSLRGSIAEDDDHLLLQWHDRDEHVSNSALVRCTVSTGACEVAAPLAPGALVIGS